MQAVKMGILFTLAVVAVGCGRVETASAPLAPIPTNAAVPPEGPTSVKEVYVTDSVPIAPGTPIAIVDTTTNSLLVNRVVPSNVRWKADSPFSTIAYPAKGFVTMSLSTSQWSALERAQSLAVRPVANPAR
jgi:hypothetical protein